MIRAMAMVTASREREVERLIGTVTAWVRQRSDVFAAAMVGSWARGEARMDSDVDVVLLTEDAAAFIDSDVWAQEWGAAFIIRTQPWGVLTERRLALASGLEVDVGVVAPSWASLSPLDPGTAKVVAGGLIPLHDPHRLLDALVAEVASHR
jgi:nucleotidyltransferase-like protein